MATVERLLKDAQTPRLRGQPKWVQRLVHDLASRLDLEVRAAVGVRAAAEVEVTRAREDLTRGPANSDTWMDLPRSSVVYDEDEQRPLGRGTNIEFRDPGSLPGEGINVKRVDDYLIVTGYSRLVVVPVNQSTIYIETR